MLSIKNPGSPALALGTAIPSFACLVSILILGAGCSKKEQLLTGNEMEIAIQSRSEPDFDSFHYTDEQLGEMIYDFHDALLNETVPATEANEALWLAEAVMNYRHNRRDGDGGYLVDTVFVDSFSIELEEDGTVDGDVMEGIFEEMENIGLGHLSDIPNNSAVGIAATDIEVKQITDEEAVFYVRYIYGRRESEWAFNCFDDDNETYAFDDNGIAANGQTSCLQCDNTGNQSANKVFWYKYNQIAQGFSEGICDDEISVCCCNTNIDITSNAGFPYVIHGGSYYGTSQQNPPAWADNKDFAWTGWVYNQSNIGFSPCCVPSYKLHWWFTPQYQRIQVVSPPQSGTSIPAGLRPLIYESVWANTYYLEDCWGNNNRRAYRFNVYYGRCIDVMPN